MVSSVPPCMLPAKAWQGIPKEKCNSALEIQPHFFLYPFFCSSKKKKKMNKLNWPDELFLTNSTHSDLK